MKKYILSALCALALIACAKSDEDMVAVPATAPETIYATFEEPTTRTYVEQDKYLRWHAEDEISFFSTTYNLQYRFQGSTGDNNGSFTKITTDLVTGNALANNYAVYPYAASTAISDEGVISVTLPATQAYAENSFGRGANTMVATTNGTMDNVLRFKNAGGYLKLQLYGTDVTVKSVALQGNKGEKIAGVATITAAYGNDPVVTMTDTATDVVTIDCGEGVTLSNDATTPTAFWFVLPETTFAEGFTVTVTDTEGGTFVKSTSNSFTIDRNMIQPMKSLEAVIEGEEIIEGPANNEIWYTATERVEPYAPKAFGATIVSHDFNATTGKGVITFDGGVTTIGDDAFYYSTLSSIHLPSGITTIGYAAFYGCSYLNTIYLPQSLTYVGKNAFYNCQRLQHIYIEDIASWCNVDMYGVDSCPSNYWAYFYLNGEKIKELTIPSTVSTIKAYAFRRADIEDLIITDGVESLGLNAFYGCDFNTLYIPNSITDLGANTFSWCHGELTINCECTTKYIPTGSPFYQNNFTKINIGDQVTTIGDYIFNINNALTDLSIGANVSSIGECSFYDTPYLKNITGKFASTDGRCLIVDNKLIAFAPAEITEYEIPEGVTELRQGIMSYENLTSITLPTSITIVGNQAFNKCNNIERLYCKAVNPPTIGSSILNANNYKIYVPYASLAAYKEADGWINYADHIVGYDFENNTIVEENPDNNEVWYTTSDEQIINLSSDVFNTSVISHTYSSGKGVIICSNDISTIAEEAFYGCKNLTSITLPNTITEIGAYAFADAGLEEFTFPTSLLSIGYNALNNCPISRLVCNSSSSMTIGTDVDFYHYEGLGRLSNLSKIEGSLASSDNMCLIINGHLAAFAGKNLTSYTIPNNVKYLDSYVFEECKMDTLSLHSNVSVFANAFYSAQIGMISIPNGTWVYDNAFQYCYGNAYIDTATIRGTSEDTYGPYELANFTEITIGPNVTDIGENAFNRVTTVYCKPTNPPSCWARPFGDVTTIYVPQNSLSKYQTASYWSDYKSKMVTY